MKFNSVASLLFAFCAISSIHAQESAPLVLSQTVALPNVQGGFNHMSVDAVHQRLFAAAPTNTTLEIVDLKTGKPWRSLPGEKPAAARYAPEFNQLYVSRGQKLAIYDGNAFDLVASIDLQSKSGRVAIRPPRQTTLRRLHDARKDRYRCDLHPRWKTCQTDRSA